jgi:hypothetical protein
MESIRAGSSFRNFNEGEIEEVVSSETRKTNSSNLISQFSREMLERKGQRVKNGRRSRAPKLFGNEPISI